MSKNDFLWFAGATIFVMWLMYRAFVRMEEGPPLDTDFWLWVASAALLVVACACFAVSAGLFAAVLT